MPIQSKIESLKAKWRAFLQTPIAPSEPPSVSIEQGIEDYFTTTDPIVVMAAFAQVRTILIARKLIRREPGARPFDIQWARNTIQQCKAAGTAVFVKQMGSWVTSSAAADWLGKPGAITTTGNGLEQKWRLKDRKGGDPAEWPEDLRVREFPHA